MKNKIDLTVNDRTNLRLILGEKAGKLLEAFYEAGILCWLDSGSLLGVVRNKKLNDWEKDVDLSIFFDDFYRAIEVSRDFAKNEGIWFKLKLLRGVPYKLSYKFIEKSGSKKQLPFDIHIFYKLDNIAWSAQSSSLLKKGSNLPDYMYKDFIEKNTGHTGFFSFARKYPLLAFCILLKRTGISKLVNVILIINQGLNMIFDRAYHNANSHIFRPFFYVCEWRVPLGFFESAAQLSDLPPHLNVPQPIDGYLAARYGDDWRIPRSKWFYVIDDGCLYPENRDNYQKAKDIYKQRKVEIK